MVCDACGATTHQITYMDGKAYCKVCYIMKYPPVFTLTRLWSAPELFYNPETFVFDYRTLEDLRGCGFFLRNIRTYKKRNYYKFREVFTFYYRGRLICPRVQAGYSWPSGMARCSADLC
jgi:hypothetical protein